MRELVLRARMDGLAATAGELIDALGQMSTSDRRALLDQARVEAGLPSIEDVERAERARAPLALGPAPMQPTTEIRRRADGSFYEAPLVEPRMVRTPGGGIADASVLEADAARQRELEASDRRQRQARAADANLDAEQMRALEAARREQLRTELPDHLRETAA
jgi:hypothetical protein